MVHEHILLFIIVLFCCQAYTQRWGDTYWKEKLRSYEAKDIDKRFSNWRGWWNDDIGGYKGYARPEQGHACSGCRDCEKAVKDSSLLRCKGPDITLHKHDIQQLHEGVFGKDVRVIKIRSTKITYIHPNVFKGLTALTELIIIDSQLYEMPDLSDCVKLKKLDLYSNNIQLFRHNYTKLPQSIEELILIKNRIDKIPRRYFDLPNLKFLGLGQNQMRYIPGNSFHGVLKLIYLGVDGNRISSISKRELQELASANQLLHLNMSNNIIDYVAPQALKTLKKLEILELFNNSIKSVNKNVFWMIPNLLHLDLHHNNIEVLTSQFITYCEKLRWLTLHSQKDGTKLKTVYFDSLYKLPELSDLLLGSNALTKFPHPVFSEKSVTEYWPNFRNLFLDNNQITSLRDYSSSDFPPSSQVFYLSKKDNFKPFEFMTGLYKIDISNNKVNEIREKDLEYCKTLQTLNLDGNLLQENAIHENAFQNTSLVTLNLAKQSPGIQYVPKALGSKNLKDIQHIYLEDNKITYILNETFSNLPKLQTLSISRNNIIAIEDGALPLGLVKLFLSGNNFNFKNEKQFKGLSKLEELELDFNKIDVIPNDAFHGMTSLEIIKLQSNKIGRILRTHFKDMSKLREIYLRSNDLAFVEDGTFAHMRHHKNEIQLIDLSNNHLTRIPHTDFWNLKIKNLKLNDNRITEVQSNAFVNISRPCDVINLHVNRIERIKGYGFNDVDCGQINVGGKTLTVPRVPNNRVKEIERHAYYNVKVDQIDLSYLQIKVLPSYAFKLKGLGNTLYLNNGLLQSIDTFAFDLGKVTGDIDLSVSKIVSLRSRIFVNGTSFTNLNLKENQISVINDNAFLGASMNGKLELHVNQLKVFPAKALSVFTKVKEIIMYRNKIEALKAGSLDPFTELTRLELQLNKIKILENDIFKNNAKLEYVWIDNNEIHTIQDDVFSVNGKQLKHIWMHANPINHIPQIKTDMPKLEEFRASNVKTVAKDVFGTHVPKLRLLKLETNMLQCDCHFHKSISEYRKKSPGSCNIEARIQCTAPNGLKYFAQFCDNAQLNAKKSSFICTPYDVKATAPADYTIKIEYTYPETYIAGGDNINTARNKLYFEATCVLEDGTGSALKGAVENKKEIIISGDDVVAGRTYHCYVLMTFTQSSGVNITSAQTRSVSVTTQAKKEKETLCASGDPYECQLRTTHTSCVTGCNVAASNAIKAGSCDLGGCCTRCYKSCIKCNDTVDEIRKVEIRYYDFSVESADFSADEYKADDCCPIYVPSPYESWLASHNSPDPKTDPQSDWFRDTTRNEIKDKLLTLSSERGVRDPINSEKIFTYWNEKYWPMNGEGYKEEGQRNCDSELINLGFTSAIRTGFTFTGTEHFQFAGGEDLWVYIDKVLILHIIISVNDTKRDTTHIQCKTFQLKNVTDSGGLIIPSLGSVDRKTKSCVIEKELHEESVFLKLKPGINYGLDIFHVERFLCRSEFLFRASGVTFISPEELKTSKPRIDYLAYAGEDLYTKAIIADILITDQHSSEAPYTITIESGNEEERFLIQENSTVVHEAARIAKLVPPKRVYENVTLHGEAIIICPNSTNSSSSSKIEKTKFGPQVFADIRTRSVLLTLQKNLDYESTSEYVLRLSVTDAKGNQGNITVKVLVEDKSDNCPIMKSKPKVLINRIPPLQEEPFIIVQANDADAGDNGRVSYVVSEVISEKPEVTIKEYENITTSWTITVNIFAIDNGNPRRGDFFPVSVTYKPSCHDRAKIIVNETSGAVYFVAPAMTIYNESKFRYGKDDCYECTAGYYCPGDGQELHCVQDEKTKYYFSYGFATTCSKCTEGSICHNGLITKCAPNTHVKCNDTWCPDKCFPCPPGTYCHEGVRYDCHAGTYSDGKGPCRLCPPGSFSNSSQATKCECCAAGYESTEMKIGCKRCEQKEYSPGKCTICKSCWPPGSCACDKNPCFPGVLCHNVGVTGSSYKCDACPIGYNGNGETCVDVNECAVVDPCDGECINLSPGFRCKGCKPGFKGNAPAGVGVEVASKNKQTCKDLNECETGEHLCDPNAYCHNSIGSYSCGKCKPGFVGDGYRGCILGDYCKIGKHDCHTNATCIPLGSEKFHCQCKDGFAGDGNVCEIDDDYDGISSFGAACSGPACEEDKCKYTPNGGQEDADEDSLGDVCDDDDDDDYIKDIKDNCPFKVSRSNRDDTDNDTVGDICDNCKNKANTDQSDIDNDTIGDACDDDIDGDGILNDSDNCKYVSNKDQTKDVDGDGVGDVCDNCYKLSNADQKDDDKSGFGDACEGSGKDSDGDGIPNDYDNCELTPNADQSDQDGDGKGDLCDTDKDGDKVEDELDNCVYISNPSQNHTVNYDMSAKEVGTACVDDYDGDGVEDKLDVCPFTSIIKSTSFKKHIIVDLAGPSSTEPKPVWRITNNGRDIEQLKKTLRPSMLIGDQRYGEVEYSGVLHVNSEEGIDYFGVVFGYQSNKKFLVAIWRHENINLLNSTYKAGIKGIQIKLVTSKAGPSEALEYALWHSQSSVDGEIKMLWHDPEMKGWLHRTPYIFRIEFRPSIGRIRLQIKQGIDVITDSGYIYETLITGGRLGVYTHGQWNTIWSKLEAKCLQSVNRALLFDGNDTCVTLPTMNQLNIVSSFIFGVWIKLPADFFSTDDFPLVCTSDRSVCLYIKNKRLEGKIAGIKTSGEVLTENIWYSIFMRFDAQDRELRLFVNGKSVGNLTLPKLSINVNEKLYVGCDESKYYRGVIDEITIWHVYLTNEELKRYMSLPGLTWQKHKRLITAHYSLDQEIGTSVLDTSEFGNHANVTDALWVESSLNYKRFRLTYPTSF